MMKTNNMKHPDSKIPKRYLIPVIILSITALLLTCSFIAIYKDNHSKIIYNNNMFLYTLDANNYARAYDYYGHNISLEKETSRNSDVYAICRYWHNSFYYYAFKGTQNADQYLEKMDESRAATGDFKYITDQIDQIFKSYQ